MDAVTNQALAWRRRFDAWGWGGGDYAEVLAPGMQACRSGRCRPTTRPGSRVVHYSGFAPELERRVSEPVPAAVAQRHAGPVLLGARAGRGDRLRARAAAAADAAPSAPTVVAGVSAFNVAELGRADARVIPILFDRSQLPDAPGTASPPQGPPTVLFVGRLAPHKRQDLVVRAFALYRRTARAGRPARARRHPDLPRLRRTPAAARRRARAGRGHLRQRHLRRRAARPLPLRARLPVPVRARGLLHPAAGGVPLRRARHRPCRRRRPGGRRRRRGAASDSGTTCR